MGKETEITVTPSKAILAECCNNSLHGPSIFDNIASEEALSNSNENIEADKMNQDCPDSQDRIGQDNNRSKVKCECKRIWM